MIAEAIDHHTRRREGMLPLPGSINHHHHLPCPVINSEPHGVRISNRGAVARAARPMDNNHLTAIQVLLPLIQEAQPATAPPAEETEGLLVTAQHPPDRQDTLLLPGLLGLPVPVTVQMDLPDPLATDKVCLADHRVMHPLEDLLLDPTAMELMVLITRGLNSNRLVINSIHTTHRTNQGTVEGNNQETSCAFFFLNFLNCGGSFN